MIIAKSSAIFETTPILLGGNAVSSGNIENITRSNFSETVTINVTNPDFEVVFGARVCDYVAFHGVTFTNAGRGTPITVEVLDNTTVIGSIDLNSGFSDIFFHFTARSFASLRVKVYGSSGNVTISYAAAGRSTQVPFGGAKPGQILPYLQYNYKTKANENSIGAPTNQRLRRVATQVNINLNNMPVEWARDDLKQVFDLFQKTQVVSMRDFESEAFPTESWAGFQLSQTKASTYNGTRKLVSVPLTFKASCDYVGYYD